MEFQVLMNHCTTGIAIRGNEVFTTNRNGFVGVFDARRGLEERKIGDDRELGDDREQLRNPVDLVLLGEKLYVTDAKLNKVQCFNAADGAHNPDQTLRVENDDGFRPQYIASDGHDKIYVTSPHNKTLYVFQNGRVYVHDLSTPDAPNMAPFDVAVDANGRILVTHRSHNDGFIKVFSPDDMNNLIGRIILRNNAIPYRIATDEESRYFVTSFDGGSVYLHVYQLQNGNFVETQQIIQLGSTTFDNLFCGIAVQNGRVYCGYDKPFVQSIAYRQ